MAGGGTALVEIQVLGHSAGELEQLPQAGSVAHGLLLRGVWVACPENLISQGRGLRNTGVGLNWWRVAAQALLKMQVLDGNAGELEQLPQAGTRAHGLLLRGERLGIPVI